MRVVTKARQAAARGAEYLDRVHPGWYRDINTDELQMSSGYDCILGQLGQKFIQGEFGSMKAHLGLSNEQAARRGFVTPAKVENDGLDYPYYSALTEAWVVLIDRRSGKEKF